MDKFLVNLVAAVFCAGAFAFTRTADTNCFTKGAVEYSQRGRLGTADYVPTSTNLLASDTGALTNDANFKAAVNSIAVDRGAVFSVNGKVGNVTLGNSDVGAWGTGRGTTLLPTLWNAYWPNSEGTYSNSNYIAINRDEQDIPEIDLSTRGTNGVFRRLVLDGNRVYTQNGNTYRQFRWDAIVSTNDFNDYWLTSGDRRAVTSDAVLDYLAGNYYGKNTADSRYLTRTDAASNYLTKADAPETYLMKTNAATIYLTQMNAALNYTTKVGATNIATEVVEDALDAYQANYIYNADNSAFRTGQDGTKQYKQWSGVGIDWVGEDGTLFSHSNYVAGVWYSTNSVLGNVCLKYEDGVYYITTLPIVRYTETLERQTQIELRRIGTLNAVVATSTGDIGWTTYGKEIGTDSTGIGETEIGAATDWIFNQGTSWELDDLDSELYWGGQNWNAVEDGVTNIVTYKSGSCASGDVVFRLTRIDGTETNTYDTAVFDSHASIGTYEAFRFTNGTDTIFGTRNIKRGIAPFDYSVPDWARAETPPNSASDVFYTNTIIGADIPMHGTNAVVIGLGALSETGTVDGVNGAVAIGEGAKASALAVAVGYYARYKDNDAPASAGRESVAIGAGARSSYGAVAAGRIALAEGIESIAIGHGATISTNIYNSTAIGKNATASNDNSLNFAANADRVYFNATKTTTKVGLNDNVKNIVTNRAVKCFSAWVCTEPSRVTIDDIWYDNDYDGWLFIGVVDGEEISVGKHFYNWDRNAVELELPTYYVTFTRTVSTTNTLGLVSYPDLTAATNAVLAQATNAMDKVKAQFWDEQLQVNWTMKMVNGEMKLYATTNVNLSGFINYTNWSTDNLPSGVTWASQPVYDSSIDLWYWAYDSGSAQSEEGGQNATTLTFGYGSGFTTTRSIIQ